MSHIRLGCKLKLSVTAAGSGQRTAAYGATEIERERRGCSALPQFRPLIGRGGNSGQQH